MPTRSMVRPLWGALLACALAAGTSTALAQGQARSTERFPDAPGRELALSKCFQCHSDSMWTDHRQDRRGWEAVLYRMVGRGALWTEEEIGVMAGYFAAAFGTRPPVSSK